LIASSIDLSLDAYLQVCTKRYAACLDSLPDVHDVSGVQATARFHHLKLDGNGRPRWRDLANNLASHILSYCFSAQKREGVRTDIELLELRREAREFFRDARRSGEAGEMLLYFLLEAVLRAPQIVAKISLKTNPQLETFGSDGIHMKWQTSEKVLDLYFGEAKLYADLGKAATEAVESIETFHANQMEEFELRMVTNHFKHVNHEMKEEVLKYVRRSTAVETVRINHACLLGYDWDAYDKLPDGRLEVMVDAFRAGYQKDLCRIRNMLDGRFERFRRKRLRFEIFVLPFTSVDAFRQAFLEAL
jgi:hypothetical protein